jgi:hypothetical protein
MNKIVKDLIKCLLNLHNQKKVHGSLNLHNIIFMQDEHKDSNLLFIHFGKEPELIKENLI